jgi:LuxR family maltose regulon positive regulatory protein
MPDLRAPPTPIRSSQSTKVVRPELVSDHLVRARLLDLLDRGLERRLTLVSAPGGYGKTTLLSAWSPPDHAVAWLSLDEGDVDLRVFGRALVSAVDLLVPGAVDVTLSLLNLVDLPSPATLAAQLADDLADLPDSLVIVLDDYHTIQDDEIHTLVGRVIDRMAENVHLVIATRHDPPLPLARLRARAALAEIRLEQLAFTADEARAFFSSRLPTGVGDKAVDRLTDRAEGWAAGLRLATLALPSDAVQANVPIDVEARGVRYMHEFLTDDVFAAQPPDLQDILLRSAILDRFCAPLLDALYAESDRTASGVQSLQALRRANLFVTALDTGGIWFRLHHLFRDALRRRLLAERGTERVSALHRRAGEWYAQHDMVEEAIRHALAATDTAFALSIFEECLPTLFDGEDEPARLEDCLRMFPADVVDRSPVLLLARTLCLLLRDRATEMPVALRAAGDLLDEDHDRDLDTTEALRGAISTCWAYVWYSRSDGERLIECTEHAVRQLSNRWPALRGFAEYLHAVGLTMLGRQDDAEAWLNACRVRITPADRLRLGMVLRSSGRLHYDQCRIRKIGQTATELLALSDARHLPRTAAWGHLLAGLASYDWSELDEARDHFLAAIEDRARVGVFIALDGMLGLATTQQALGDAAGARATLLDMAPMVNEMGSTWSNRLLLACQARLALARGDLDEAGRLLWCVRSDEPVSFRSFVEVPEITLARWHLAQGHLEEVAMIVARLHHAAAASRHLRGLIHASAVEALLLQARGDVDGAIATLVSVVDLARPNGLLQLLVDFGSPMQRLLGEMMRLTQPLDPYLTRVLAAYPPTTGPIAAAVPARAASESGACDVLTWREQEILAMLEERLSDQEIATALVISARTVKKHATNIYRKLQVVGRREAVARACALGLLPITHRVLEP